MYRRGGTRHPWVGTRSRHRRVLAPEYASAVGYAAFSDIARGVPCEIAVCAAAAMLARESGVLRHARVRIFVLTSRASIETRLRPMLDTWIADARRAGLDVVLYASEDSAPAVRRATGEPVLSYAVRDTYPPFDIHVELLADMARWAADDRDIEWLIHFDDDAYVDVPALLRMLAHANPRKRLLLGIPKYNEPASVHVYCIGFAVALSGALARDLAVAGATRARVYALLDEYRAIRATHILSDDVFAWGFVPVRLLGIECTAPSQGPKMGVHADPGKPDHRAMRRTGDIVAYHKLVGRDDVVCLHSGRAIGNCGRA